MAIGTIQLPSVGRVVHYYAHGSADGKYPTAEARAAIITEVDDPGDAYSNVGLCVLNPTGQFFNRSTPYGPEQPGCWGWPPQIAPISPRDYKPTTPAGIRRYERWYGNSK